MERKYKSIDVEKIKRVIEEMREKSLVKRVHFLGGEPTINPFLEDLLKFCRELNLYTCLGHTNGSKVVDVNEANISIKAYTEEKHIECTGVSNKTILENFIRAYDKGIKLKANTVFIPDFIDYEEIEKIAKFIASIDNEIPYHIIGYIPVPSAPWRRPHFEEVVKAAKVAKNYLKYVTFSCPDENFTRDEKYASFVII